ncbi:hypothetical protein [Pseudomonas sp. TNT2022 ID642]|uniref:hypothetical protein n=1 Tax=Pseudomonas sp. TNT2022 ID642 TaxID=2942632 RepID=UPI00235DEA0F|nr:hypothetical protein [Pseudomonas sp. TNT2022 ID642]MDD1002174.1 hypothetical protein [Pseudomonas sp. TNT2022 ID642]
MSEPSVDSTDSGTQASDGREGRECVPFFKKDETQITFEFFYLLGLLLAVAVLMLLIQFEFIPMEYRNKVFVFALLGGFLGGWVYDTKWFYRVTARGKNDQHKYKWQCHKFYWRVLTPFLSSLVAFVTYILVASGLFPVVLKNSAGASAAFSICFLFGYFSDLVLSRLAAWAEDLLPKLKSNTSDVNRESNSTQNSSANDEKL